jgi:acyl carrier protein
MSEHDVNPEPDDMILAPLSQADAERIISSAWCELLDLDEPRRNENFFDVGGDSLMLFELHTRLEDRFSRPINLMDMLRFPTITSFAAWLTQGSAQQAGTTAWAGRCKPQSQGAPGGLPWKGSPRNEPR